MEIGQSDPGKSLRKLKIMNKKRIVQYGDWVSPNYGCESYLNQGMKYQVHKVQSDGNAFIIVDNDCDEIACRLSGCCHSPNGWYIHSREQAEMEDNVENLIEIL